tara:strand:+ start:15020 stop:15391 length:372 start_codon:yes stop_codon:yes gene_type:complete
MGINEVVRNYRELTDDIAVIKKKLAFLNKHKKKMEQGIIDYLKQTNTPAHIGTLQLVKTQHKGTLNRKYIKTTLGRYYTEYYERNRKNIKPNEYDFVNRKTKSLYRYLLSNVPISTAYKLVDN